MFGIKSWNKLKFPAGILVGIMAFSGSAVAYENYVSDNTPANGYLLCANNKTKAVTFPNKLTCPTGTKALDLGAVTGVEGPEGPEGPAGPQGIPGATGRDATQKTGYLVTLKPQDVIASVASKSDRTLISKSGFVPGYYNLFGEISFLFQNPTQQVVLCTSKTTGSSYAYSAFPSHEVANTWTGHTSQFLGSLWISSLTDTVNISCTFSGNTKASWGYISLTPIAPPTLLSSDS
jgi:hypothetical protein